MIVRVLAELAHDLGVDLGGELARWGIDLNGAETTATVSDAAERALWELLCAKSHAHGIGLRAAQRLTRGAFRGLEYCVRSCDTVGEGLEQVARFSRLLHGVGLFEALRGPSLRLRYTVSREALLSQIEFDVAAVVRLARDSTAQPWTPVVVRLAHPSSGEEHEQLAVEYFNCPVEFAATSTEIELAEADLRQPMREADEILHDVLEDHLEALMDTPAESSSMSSRIGVALRNQLARGDASLAGVGERIGVGTRTIQRQLTEEGTSYREVLEQTRSKLARRYFASDGVSISGVAALLGYSDPTAFHRAFRRWVGMAPGDFRRRRQS